MRNVAHLFFYMELCFLAISIKMQKNKHTNKNNRYPYISVIIDPRIIANWLHIQVVIAIAGVIFCFCLGGVGIPSDRIPVG